MIALANGFFLCERVAATRAYRRRRRRQTIGAEEPSASAVTGSGGSAIFPRAEEITLTHAVYIIINSRIRIRKPVSHVTIMGGTSGFTLVRKR